MSLVGEGEQLHPVGGAGAAGPQGPQVFTLLLIKQCILLWHVVLKGQRHEILHN